MKPILSIHFVAWLLFTSGCTHVSLQKNTVRTTATLTEIYYNEVLNNVALLQTNPDAIPSAAVVAAGTVTVSDETSFEHQTTYAPTLRLFQQIGGFPILALLFNPSQGRTVTENWSLTPVTASGNLRRLRCAYQLLVLSHGLRTCDSCTEELRAFFLGQSLDQLIPQGWYFVGKRYQVPRDAAYVGHYGKTYVWVMPDGVAGLSRFTLTVLDLATGKPFAPKKTVVRQYKGKESDENLVSTEVTTEAIDRAALRTLGRERALFARPRITTDMDPDRGLNFIPE